MLEIHFSRRHFQSNMQIFFGALLGINTFSELVDAYLDVAQELSLQIILLKKKLIYDKNYVKRK